MEKDEEQEKQEIRTYKLTIQVNYPESLDDEALEDNLGSFIEDIWDMYTIDYRKKIKIKVKDISERSD